jgi:hypothetical protein
MVGIGTIRNALPPFRNEKVIITSRQGTGDIINEILKTHTLFEADYDRIYAYFDTGDIYSTSQTIWNFLKHNLRYNAESDGEQSVKSPSAILHPGEHIDCKHYALFTGGVLDAIKRNMGDNWDWCYRFVSYHKGEDFGHVFVVVTDHGNDIWIDPVLTNFNQRKSYYKFIDKQPMSLVRISGIGAEPVTKPDSATVNKNFAWISFLNVVVNNTFSIRELLKTNPVLTAGALRNYCLQQGFDYDQLMRFLNASK